jgi:hypothetical protein
MSKGLNLYKSYNFRNKDPIIDEVRTLVNGTSYKEIHNASGVSVTTLHGWFNGKTRRPQYATIMAVVHAVGYRSRLVRSKKPV